MFDWFHKTLPENTLYVWLVKILHHEKRHMISTPVYLKKNKKPFKARVNPFRTAKPSQMAIID